MMKMNSLTPKPDPDKTHKFEMDVHGNLEHSDSCWCLHCIPIPDVIKNVEEPKNNDGRKKCFWCGKDTVRKELLTTHYDICESCGK